MLNNYTELYNSVWNNIYLKKIILYHTTLYNIFSLNLKFKSIEEWEQFEYKQYLKCATFGFDFDLKKLPQNITKVYYSTLPQDKNEQIFIPDHVESIYITIKVHKESTLKQTDLNSAYLNSISSKLKSLSLMAPNDNENDYVQPNSIPHSITSLNIFTNKLLNNVLPNNLQKLTIYGINQFEDSIFPPSLSYVNLLSGNPLLVNQLSNGLVRLDLSASAHSIGGDILFPNTLEELNINCFSFNAKLPNLKSLKLFMENLEYQIQFPSSLINLTVHFVNNVLNQQVFQHSHLVPPNLKKLNLTCSTIQDINGYSIIPNELENLYIIGRENILFNDLLLPNQLPNSLKELHISSFNQPIDIDVLPSNLETLGLGIHYSQIINPLAIPKSLKLLNIHNENYNHPINLTLTHPYTAVLLNNIQYYYDPSNTDIRVLRLPDSFNSTLESLELNDKSKLEYLNLGLSYNFEIESSYLPNNNIIKTLELSSSFKYAINLEDFKQLETIIINLSFMDVYSLSKQLPKITTTINHLGQHNNYSLKQIIISPQLNISRFIKQLDSNFYKYLKVNK